MGEEDNSRPFYSHYKKTMEPIRISYYSDVLCVWAYIAQIRLDELAANFPDQVAIDYHFFPVFGNTHEKLEKRWRDKGGLRGYSDHVHSVAAKYPHITVHPDIWVVNTPTSATSCHLFLNAIQLLEIKGMIPKSEKIFDSADRKCLVQIFYVLPKKSVTLHNVIKLISLFVLNVLNACVTCDYCLLVLSTI